MKAVDFHSVIEAGAVTSEPLYESDDGIVFGEKEIPFLPTLWPLDYRDATPRDVNSHVSSMRHLRDASGTLVKSSPHNGVDVPLPLGTRIFAAGTGKVIHAAYSKSFGWWLVIAHSKGVNSVYAHFSSKALVTTGSRVTQGQLIGYSGNSGVTKKGTPVGKHLHYEVRRGDRGINPPVASGHVSNPLDWVMLKITNGVITRL